MFISCLLLGGCFLLLSGISGYRGRFLFGLQCGKGRARNARCGKGRARNGRPCSVRATRSWPTGRDAAMRLPVAESALAPLVVDLAVDAL